MLFHEAPAPRGFCEFPNEISCQEKEEEKHEQICSEREAHILPVPRQLKLNYLLEFFEMRYEGGWYCQSRVEQAPEIPASAQAELEAEYYEADTHCTGDQGHRGIAI